MASPQSVVHLVQSHGVITIQCITIADGVRHAHVRTVRPFNESKALQASLKQLNAMLSSPNRAWVRWICGASGAFDAAMQCKTSTTDVAQVHAALAVIKQELKPSGALWYGNAVNAALKRLTNYRRSVHSHVRTDTPGQ